jgi:hypothetical protein
MLLGRGQRTKDPGFNSSPFLIIELQSGLIAPEEHEGMPLLRQSACAEICTSWIRTCVNKPGHDEVD